MKTEAILNFFVWGVTIVIGIGILAAVHDEIVKCLEVLRDIRARLIFWDEEHGKSDNDAE